MLTPILIVASVNGVKQHGVQSPLPVLQQTFPNFFNREPDGFDGSLDIDSTFCGLGQHGFGSDHTCARSVLYSLYLETLAADNGAHEIVGDEETYGVDGGRRVCGHELSDDKSVCLEVV